MFAVEPTSPESTAVLVPAGSFAGCEQRISTIRWGFLSYTARSWHHPGVPIHGMVKAMPTDHGEPEVTELLSYGLEGARSEVLDEWSRSHYSSL